MESTAIKTRFAPSPTGYMHLGNARTALFNALLAQREGGIFLLRIEDTDQERSQPGYLDALLQDLSWLGLEWQEGYGRAGEPCPRCGAPLSVRTIGQRSSFFCARCQR